MPPRPVTRTQGYTGQDAGVNVGNNATVFSKAGVPTDGTSGDGVDFAGPGSLCIDVTNKDVYMNTNTLASPTWTKKID